MNWDAIGAAGELIGALVVLGTLVYLAIQIRQSAQATRSATEMQATELLSNWIEPRTVDAKFQSIWNDLAQAKEVSEEDKIYFIWSVSSLGVKAQGVLDQYKAGLVSEQCWHNFERPFVGLLTIHDFVGLWWQGRDASFSPSFYDHIDSVLENNSHRWAPRSNETWSASNKAADRDS